MALTKAKKQEVIAEVSTLLANAKLTVVAKYDGTSVKQMQALRKAARDNATVVKVVKNRLVIKALSDSDTYKDADKSQLTTQLLYAFNSEDEVAPAQALADFAKKNPSIQFVGAFTSDGQFMAARDVQALASLPSKPQLIASVIATLNAPINGVLGGLSGDLHSLLNAIEAKAPAAV